VFGLGTTEIIVIFGAMILLFGAKRLPEIGKSLGKGIREFKGSISEIRQVEPGQDQSQLSSSGSASDQPAEPAESDPVIR